MSSSGGYHHGNLRAALLAGARELLERSSATELSLREVARQAGVSHNAPYHHFSDRNALRQELAAEVFREFLAAQYTAADGEGSAGERLIAVGMAYTGYAVEHPNAFALIFDPEVCPPGAPGPAMKALIDENMALLDRMVRAANPGLPDAETAALGAGLWAAVHGLADLVGAGHLAPEAIEPALRTLAAGSGAGRPR